MTTSWTFKFLGVAILSGGIALTYPTVKPAWAESDQDDPGMAPVETFVLKEFSEDDPLEPLNRVTSGFNQYLRDLIFDPLVSGYKAVTPEPVQEGISNAVSNLSEPVTAVSSLLQGDTENASNATKRFFINSTIGLGGLNDEATDMGITSREEDLGQSFATHGVEKGTYIVLPLIGPSNLRDATGDALTSLANPMPLVGEAATGAVEYSDNRDQIDAALAGAVDQYTRERAIYEQFRQNQINNGRPGIPGDESDMAGDAPTLLDEDFQTQ